jgi:hypothetical protein
VPRLTVPAAEAGAIKVLMVIGVGRSGSTVLDIVLGNQPEIESAGELINIARSGWINNEYCACGRRVQECDYWNAVRQALEERTGPFDPADHLRLQREFERARRLFHLLSVLRRPSEDFRRYGEQTLAIYQAILQVGQRPLIVDSSKNALRALALSFVRGLDVYVVHLVRDARGVTWSLRKPYRRDDAAGVQRDMPPRPAWRTALMWTWGNTVAAWVSRRFPRERRRLLRYEDFLSDPEHALAGLGRFLGVEMGGLGTRVVNGDLMSAGHNIAGNRLRMQGSVRLRPDFEWRGRLSGMDRATVWTLAWPLLLWYGYRR